MESSTPHPGLRSPANHKKKHSTSRGNRPAPISSKKTNGSRSHRRQSSDEDVKHGKTIVVTDYDDNVLGEFCATCEKQFTTPGTGRLYCSSKCAGQDSKRNSAAYPLHKTDIYLADTPPASPASATVPDSPSYRIPSSRRTPSSYRYINYQSDTDRDSDSEIDRYLHENKTTPSGSRPRFSRTITISALQDLGKKPQQNYPSASGINSVPLSPTSSRNSLESILEPKTSSSHPPAPYRSCRTRSRGSRWSNRSIDLVTPILNSPSDSHSQADVIEEGDAEGSDYGFPSMGPGEEAPKPLEINGAANRLSYDISSPATPSTPAIGLTRSHGYTTLSKLLHPEPGPFMPGRPNTPRPGSPRPSTPRTKSTSTLIVK